MRLVDNCNAKPSKYQIEDFDKSFDVLGVSQKNVQEFTSKNIRDFNTVATDVAGVDYFSIGSQKAYLQVCDQLKRSSEVISEGLVTNRSDGLVMPEEAKWGEYLLTFEQDHFEMVGFNADYNPTQVYNIIADNIKLCEVKNNEQEAY